MLREFVGKSGAECGKTCRRTHRTPASPNAEVITLRSERVAARLHDRVNVEQDGKHVECTYLHCVDISSHDSLSHDE